MADTSNTNYKSSGYKADDEISDEELSKEVDSAMANMELAETDLKAVQNLDGWKDIFDILDSGKKKDALDAAYNLHSAIEQAFFKDFYTAASFSGNLHLVRDNDRRALTDAHRLMKKYMDAMADIFSTGSFSDRQRTEMATNFRYFASAAEEFQNQLDVSNAQIDAVANEIGS